MKKSAKHKNTQPRENQTSERSRFSAVALQAFFAYFLLQKRKYVQGAGGMKVPHRTQK